MKNTIDIYKKSKYFDIKKIIAKKINSLYLSLKFQLRLIKANPGKSSIMIICSILGILFSAIIGISLSIVNNYRDAVLNSWNPYNSYLETRPYSRNSDLYIPQWGNQFNTGDILENNTLLYQTSTVIHPDGKNSEDKRPEPNDAPSIDSGYLPSDNDIDKNPTLGTFDYKNYANNIDYINAFSIFNSNRYIDLAPNPNDNNKLETTAYQIYNSDNYTNENVRVNIEAIANLYTSIVTAFGELGLGGLVFNQNLYNGLAYADGYSYYYFHLDGEGDVENPYTKAWLLSREVARGIALILLNGPANSPSGQAIFGRYVDQEDPRESDEYELGFSHLLVDVISFFAPYYIRANFSNHYNDIFSFYNPSTPLPSAEPFRWISAKNTLDYYNEFDNNIFYLSIGSIPYSPENGDELYTNISGNIGQINNNNGKASGLHVQVAGLSLSNDFLNKQSNGKNALINNLAFATYDNTNPEPTSDNALPNGVDKPMPVLINGTLAKKYDLHKNDIINYQFERKIPQSAGNWNFTDSHTENVLIKVVGITSNYGLPQIYTSRQEANYMVFEEYSSNDKTFIPFSREPYIWGDPGQANPDPAAITKNFPADGANVYPTADGGIVYNVSSLSKLHDEGYISENTKAVGYGDGYGYYNACLYKDNFSPTAGIILNSNGEYRLTQGLPFDSATLVAVSGAIFQAEFNSVEKIIYIILLTLFFILIIITGVLFILGQRIIFDSNKKVVATLKTQGYSTRRILFITTGIYFALGAVLLIVIISFHTYISKFIFSFFSNILNLNTYVPLDHLFWYSIITYLGIVFIFYFTFLFLALRGIRKAKAKDVLEY